MVDLGAMQKDYEKKKSKAIAAFAKQKSLLAQYDRAVDAANIAGSDMNIALNALRHATRAVTNS